jgi:hypothetical protein
VANTSTRIFGIAPASRNDMHVEMEDCLASGGTAIDANIEAIDPSARFDRLPSRIDRPHEGSLFLVGGVKPGRCMSYGDQ